MKNFQTPKRQNSNEHQKMSKTCKISGNPETPATKEKSLAKHRRYKVPKTNIQFLPAVSRWKNHRGDIGRQNSCASLSTSKPPCMIKARIKNSPPATCRTAQYIFLIHGILVPEIACDGVHSSMGARIFQKCIVMSRVDQ